MGVQYRAHVQGHGWQGWVADDAVAGITGQSRRLEALEIRLTGGHPWSIVYRAHVASTGWQEWVMDGVTAGTTGQSRRMEALQVLLVRRG
jgi:uncharacterized protein YjdB